MHTHVYFASLHTITLHHQGPRSTGSSVFPQESEGRLRLSLEGKRHESDLVEKFEFRLKGRGRFPTCSDLIIFDPSLQPRVSRFFLFDV